MIDTDSEYSNKRVCELQTRLLEREANGVVADAITGRCYLHIHHEWVTLLSSLYSLLFIWLITSGGVLRGDVVDSTCKLTFTSFIGLHLSVQ